MTTTATTTSRPQVQETAAVVAAIIDAAVPADQTPARRFLARHWIWPPYGIGPDLPSSVLWLPLRALASVPSWCKRNGEPRHLGLPVTAAGAVVYCWAPSEADPDGVSIEAVTDDGNRLQPRWKRSHGRRSGRTFTVRDAAGGSMVLALLKPDGIVRAVGRAGYRESAVADPDGRPVVLVPNANHVSEVSVLRMSDRKVSMPPTATSPTAWPTGLRSVPASGSTTATWTVRPPTPTPGGTCWRPLNVVRTPCRCRHDGCGGRGVHAFMSCTSLNTSTVATVWRSPKKNRQRECELPCDVFSG